LAVFLVICLPVGAIGGLTGWLVGAELIKEGPYFGLVVGLATGLNRGGSAVIQHYALRLTLCRKDHMPLNLVNFLDHCAKLILLKKVGGGYIFIHRMLLDYFADLPTEAESRHTRK
jgi:hypothetical protein